MLTKQNIDELLELANHYPSPHNGQPISLKIKNNDELELYFVKERGLQATDISLIFSFVSMGVFEEHLRQSAKALGHDLISVLTLPKEQNLKGSGLIKIGNCKIYWNKFPRDEQLEQVLRNRQTSRKKYYSGLNHSLAEKAASSASAAGMELVQLDKEAAKGTIWLNQRAVFDDMFDDAARRELDYWLRYSPEQKEAKQDGLAFDCMELNGKVMKFIINHHRILRWPGISQLLKNYYLRTMSDESSVFYMLAPFATEKDAFEVGQMIIKIWLLIAADENYIHPFGTIMSNHAAHKDFIKLTGIKNESREKSYLVFIFRAGKSKKPVRSLRINYRKHLLLR